MAGGLKWCVVYLVLIALCLDGIWLNLSTKHGPHFTEFADLLQDTGAPDAILKPAIGAFDLASGLRGKGIDDLETQAAHHLSPLRVDIVSPKHMLPPYAVPSLYKAEDAQGVNVVVQGQAEGL